MKYFQFFILSMPKHRSLLVFILLAYTPLLLSHGVGFEIDRQEATVIQLHHGHDTPLANADYELFMFGEQAAFQSGKTDALGRVAFITGEVRKWRLRVFNQEGHGIDTTFELTPDGLPVAHHNHTSSQVTTLILGVGILLSGFGLVMLFTRQKRG
jgi:nickel transport protein